jgi:hypothetical protein
MRVSILSMRDSAKGLLILLNRFPESLEQCLRVYRDSNDPNVQPCLLVIGVVLAEIEQEFNGVVTHFEVVDISPFKWDGISRDLVIRLH